MMGLCQLALFHDYFRDASAWLGMSERILREQFMSQVYSDGFQEELSTDYQSVMYDYAGLMDLYRKAGKPAPDYIAKDLRKSYTVMLRLARPDGLTPGLNDGGCVSVLHLAERALAVYPGDPLFTWFASGHKEGTAPDFLSDALECAGYVTFRNGWDARAVWGFLDAGDDAFRGWHSHEDALNFLLSAYGVNMIVEPGNYRYDKSEMRQYAISTFSHNTVMIDGKCQRRKLLGRAADFSTRVKPGFLFKASPRCDMVSHFYADGYGDLKTPSHVRHARTVFFIKAWSGLKPFFAIVDELTAQDGKPHACEELWHLEECALRIGGNRFVGDFGRGVTLTGCSSDPAAFVDKCGSTDPLQGWMPVWIETAEPVHRKIPTPVQDFRLDGFRRVVTVFQPNENGEESPIASVEADAAAKGCAFALVLKDGRRLVAGQK